MSGVAQAWPAHAGGFCCPPAKRGAQFGGAKAGTRSQVASDQRVPSGPGTQGPDLKPLWKRNSSVESPKGINADSGGRRLIIVGPKPSYALTRDCVHNPLTAASSRH